MNIVKAMSTCVEIGGGFIYKDGKAILEIDSKGNILDHTTTLPPSIDKYLECDNLTVTSYCFGLKDALEKASDNKVYTARTSEDMPKHQILDKITFLRDDRTIETFPYSMVKNYVFHIVKED